MTMLDRMRRHKNWLKWSLALVCWRSSSSTSRTSCAAPAPTPRRRDTIATVEGHDITAGEFRRTYQAQLQAYRSAYGANMSDQLLKQLGIEQQILQQMVDERAALAEADRLGIQVSDEEVRQRIFAHARLPGERALHRRAALPAAAAHAAAADDARRTSKTGFAASLTVEKLRAALTDWLPVPDKELEQEYRRRNDKVKLAVVEFTADSVPRRRRRSPTQDVAGYFDVAQGRFQDPREAEDPVPADRRRRAAAKITVPPADVERAYNNNIEQYSTPEQVRASHILLKTEGKDDAAVKAKAEDVLKQARSGADFAELAKKYSEDEASAKNGGDLDYFGHGRMVPEFDQVRVLAASPGRSATW